MTNSDNLCENEESHWVKWLPKLGSRAEEIRKNVRKLLDDHKATPQLPYYTIHDCDHFQAVEDLLHRLLPCKLYKRLSESERFFLLGSAWLHDVGMIKGIMTSDDKKGHKEIRDNHHSRSEEYINSSFTRLDVEESEATIFGRLAYFHRRRCSISDCDELITVTGHGTIRMRLLAAYLRLADALHIDQTRAPANQYAISLAYDIPRSSKIHWLKSKFVVGIDINHNDKILYVHLRAPLAEDNEPEIAATLNSIFDVIIQDLKDELDSVRNVLFSSAISFFLDVVPVVHEVKISDQFLKDIRSILNFYLLLDNPSSSALYRLMLESLRGIVDANPVDPEKEIKRFLEEVEENILKVRQCHIGLKNLVTKLNKYLSKISANAQQNKHTGEPPDGAPLVVAEKFKEKITDKLAELQKERDKVRHNATMFFLSLPGERNEVNKNRKEYVNVLLYGYSELVIESLCGFRDAVLQKQVIKYAGELKKAAGKKLIHSYHEENLEEKAAAQFRLFICEGQPKNHVAWNGRAIYHDGARYAQALTKEGFSNVYIIPDACAGTLVAPYREKLNIKEGLPKIDFVMVGANGFDKDKFVHSGGHAMAVALTWVPPDSNAHSIKPQNRAKVILSLITNKYGKIISNHEKTESVEHEGWTFKGSFGSELVRTQTFFTQDRKLCSSINREKMKISFYNPREDYIPIDVVDIVITEKARLSKNNIKKKNWNGKYIRRYKI